MEPIFNFGLQATQWLQTTFPQLQGFFEFVTSLGTSEYYLALMPLIYWCIHKGVGKKYAYIFIFSYGLNGFFKHGFRGPRPFWLDDSLGLDKEISYGMPSHHMQGAAITYFYLAAQIKRRWVWLPAIFLVLSMGISRVYLGVHFVHDVIAGLVIALLILFGYFIWKRRWEPKFQKRILGFRLMVMFLIPVVVALIYVGVLLLLGRPDETVSWASFIPAAEIQSIEDMTTAVSILLGMGIGLTLESSRVRFRSDGPLWSRFFRYLVGIIGAVAIWYGLGSIFPDEPLWLAIPLRVVRYVLLGLWITYYAPWLFVKIGLAQQDPEPEFELSL